MKKKIKHFILVAIIGGILYGLFSYHFIIYMGEDIKTVRPLKKSEPSFSDTFISLETGSYSGFEAILTQGTLREDGLGELLVELGLITQEELRKLEEKIDSGG
ncbi:hypothetical protein QUF72_14765 [Desulfobacterales bacterium HSG2]|nr:hypothetical protein [Desulfobacterales bacterium HSG2]